MQPNLQMTPPFFFRVNLGRGGLRAQPLGVARRGPIQLLPFRPQRPWRKAGQMEQLVISSRERSRNSFGGGVTLPRYLKVRICMHGCMYVHTSSTSTYTRGYSYMQLRILQMAIVFSFSIISPASTSFAKIVRWQSQARHRALYVKYECMYVWTKSMPYVEEEANEFARTSSWGGGRGSPKVDLGLISNPGFRTEPLWRVRGWERIHREN